MRACEEDAELRYAGNGNGRGVEPEEDSEGYGEPWTARGDAVGAGVTNDGGDTEEEAGEEKRFGWVRQASFECLRGENEARCYC